MKSLIIWHNEQKGVYYHRLINGSYSDQDYSVGSTNSYGHVIVHRVDDFDYYRKKIPIKKRIVNKSISFLKKL